MERKTLAIGIIVIVAIAAGVTSAVVFFATEPPAQTQELALGQMYLPFTIDPQDGWDSASNQIMTQVVEGLFQYDLADPNLAKEPALAVDFGNWDATHTQYTVDLRTDVTFHDGSTFDADDVVFTFERAEWLYNFTGLNTGYVPNVYELYAFPNHTQIIKDVVRVDADTVRYELNGVFGPFEDLLCYIASAILTDTYYNKTGGIVELDGDIMGTGPFVYESYEEDVEVILTGNPNYYLGAPKLTKVVFVGIIDAQARNAALLSGDIQHLYSPMDEMWNVFEDAKGITLYKEGRSAGVQYLQMNCKQINKTWREAISYAFDYDYLLNTIRYGHAYRLGSPVGYGIKYYNGTHPLPQTNYTHARLVMQSMGYGYDGPGDYQYPWNATYNPDHPSPDESKWTNAAFKTFNYSYNIGNDVREDLFIMLIANLGKVGIKVTDAGSTWSVVAQKVCELGGYTRDHLELLFIGWGPDYNDPMNFVNPLFTNRSVASNSGQYDGYLAAIEANRDPFNLWDNVQLLMELALVTPDGAYREALYDRIQELLIEDYAWVFAFSSQGPAWAHVENLMGIPYNAMGNYDLYPVYFA